MAAPSNVVNQNGISQVSADNLNTYVQFDITVSQLRSFIGITNMMVYVQGFTSATDGGQGMFYWNSTSNATDDGGLTAVVPSGSGSGAWLRIQNPTVETYSYQIPITGFSILFPSYTNALILNPAGTLATGTVTMPVSLFDGQRVEITSSQTISALTLTPNSGQTIFGAPTSITSTTPVAFIYRAAIKSFFRIV